MDRRLFLKESAAGVAILLSLIVSACSDNGFLGNVPKGSVDLGIVIKREDGSTYNLYWSKCNLGASKPWDYGDYYAWGEYETKDDISFENYKWFDDSMVTKYTGIDRTVLDWEDDAAHDKLGGKWRMPTDEEWAALREQCSWKWVTKNGVYGYQVTCKTGRSIFLPAAGNSYRNELKQVGSNGYYWSSALKPDAYMLAWTVSFSSEKIFLMGQYRYNGFSVRPVIEY